MDPFGRVWRRKSAEAEDLPTPHVPPDGESVKTDLLPQAPDLATQLSREERPRYLVVDGAER